MTMLRRALFYKTILRRIFLLKLVLIKKLNSNKSGNLFDFKINRSSVFNLYFKLVKSFPTFRNESGFTLTELMVTITVLAIIITIAMPSILTQLAHMEAKRIRNQLTTVLATAKTESYTRRQNVLVCLSDAGGRCHRDSYKKLLLFVDNNDNQNFDAQTDYLLHEQFLNPKYSTLHLRVGANRHYTKFWGDSGKPRGHFGHIKYCPTTTYNQHMYQISFNQGGIVKHKPNSTHDTGC